MPCLCAIFRGCRGHRRIKCSLTQFLDVMQGGHTLMWLPEHLKITWKWSMLWLQRPQKSSLQNCFKSEGLVQPRAASGTGLQGSVNIKKMLPGGKQCPEDPMECSRPLGNKTRQPFWVAAMALGLKSRPRPLLQAQPQCCHQMPLFKVA